jgi:mono/diheme cytochrome c family protein
MRAFARALLVVVVSIALVGLVAGIVLTRRGLSTRVQPTWLEEQAALAMRRLATPAAVRGRVNPVKATPEVLDDGLTHFADHCASCHGNDGGGTDLGKRFYPPVPDMRAERTQRSSDGELFSIIENGIRLTGMPAWGNGTPDGEASSWALVHFIRRLPRLSEAELTRMRELNPKSPAEFREEEEARRFLAGEDPAAPPQPAPPRQGHH